MRRASLDVQAGERARGASYLLVAIFGAFALLIVDRKVHVPGDAATTSAAASQFVPER